MPLVYESGVTLRPRHRVQGKHVVKKSQENGLLQTGGERGGGGGGAGLCNDKTETARGLGTKAKEAIERQEWLK